MEIFIAFMVYGVSVLIASHINSVRGTRIPKNVFDFFRLSFLPYVLYCITFNPSLLED